MYVILSINEMSIQQLVLKNNIAYGSVDLGIGGEQQVIEEESEFESGD